MKQFELLELPVWEILKVAEEEPEDADLSMLWREVDLAIGNLDYPGQLHVAGEAVSLITNVFEARSQLTFEAFYAAGSQDGPVMPGNAFDFYIRQSMQIDFEQYIEPLASLPRKVTASLKPEYLEFSEDDFEEIRQELLDAIVEEEPINSETAFQQAIALAHDENVSEWGAAISIWLNALDETQDSVKMVQLQRSIQMPLVQVWLALLLNGFQIEQHGDFYQTEQVWILRKGATIQSRALPNSI